MMSHTKEEEDIENYKALKDQVLELEREIMVAIRQLGYKTPLAKIEKRVAYIKEEWFL